jgi:hypothetical protein
MFGTNLCPDAERDGLLFTRRFDVVKSATGDPFE